jgi:hypothetical protein
LFVQLVAALRSKSLSQVSTISIFSSAKPARSLLAGVFICPAAPTIAADIRAVGELQAIGSPASSYGLMYLTTSETVAVTP